ncbi:MAG: SHOCT domain-containing protein [Clostridia bacterium]|nr:SHOCT domain-containing protein [Clostridia bacterium]
MEIPIFFRSLDWNDFHISLIYSLFFVFFILLSFSILPISLKNPIIKFLLNLACTAIIVYLFTVSLIQEFKIIQFSDEWVLEEFLWTIINYSSWLICSVLFFERFRLPKPKIREKASGFSAIQYDYERAKKLKEYHDLLEKGIITREEYDRKKKELLGF